MGSDGFESGKFTGPTVSDHLGSKDFSGTTDRESGAGPFAGLGESPANIVEISGVIKWFDASKGYGFIVGDDQQEVFVHHSGLIEKVRENDKVEFEVTEGKKGLNAVNVKKV